MCNVNLARRVDSQSCPKSMWLCPLLDKLCKSCPASDSSSLSQVTHTKPLLWETQ